MKKLIYIVPGMGEDCSIKRYKDLSRALTTIGYTVKEVNPDWYKPITEAVFRVPKNAIIFGFSMGGSNRIFIC